MERIEIPDIKKIYDDYLISTTSSYPVRSNYISMIGDECLRKLVYNRTHYEEKKPISLRLKKIFDEGKEQEQAFTPKLKKALQNAGYDLVCEQKPLEIKKYKLSGKIDGELIYNGHRIPVEIKTCSPHSFDNYKEVADFQKKSWSKKYPAQLLLYMYANNSEAGIFVLKNKSNGEVKIFVMYLVDWLDYCEELLQKGEAIEKHIAENTLPAKNQIYENCMNCEFNHICLPDLETKGFDLLQDKTIESKLDRLIALKVAKAEYEKIDRGLKPLLDGQNVMIGKYYITGKYIERRMPAKPETSTKFWQKKIEVIKG